METISILYIPAEGYIDGGGAVSLLNLLKRLDRRRFNPVVVCPSQGALVDALKSIGIKVEIIEMGALKDFHFVSFFSSIIKLSRLIKEERIDIVHSNAVCSRESFSSAIAAKMRKTPFIYHVRILDSIIWLERILVHLSDRIVVISEVVRKNLCWFKDQKKIVKIYNGIDLDEFNPRISQETMRKEFGLGPEAIVVGTTGMLVPHKGIQYFLQAAAGIVKKCPNARFLVVGGPIKKFKNYREKLEKLTGLLGLNEKVIFTGFRADLPRILAGIDIFVLASTREAFGRTLVEAMAVGKPVVATRVGGITEVVEDGVSGLLVSPRNPQAIADAVINLIRDKDKANGMGLAGRRRAMEFFDINANVQGTTELYEALIGRK